MNPRSPQYPEMAANQQSERPNPWGGSGSSGASPAGFPSMEMPQQQPAPQPQPSVSAGETLNLQCPKCGTGLKLRHEHVGIDGACIHCSEPIRAVAQPNGQVSIELIGQTFQVPQPQEEAQEVVVELQPNVPVSQSHQQVSQEVEPSLWQNQPPQSPAPAPETTPSNWGSDAQHQAQETAQPIPAFPQNTAAEESPINPSLFQTGSSSSDRPADASPAPAPAFPSPVGNGSSPLPWATENPQPPVVEQENFGSFEAVSPFGSPKPATPGPVPQQEAPQAFGGNAAAHPQQPSQPQQPLQPASSGGKKLGRVQRKRSLGWLKTIATLAVLGGLGYAGYTFAPEEKVAQAKHWLTEFVQPALEVFRDGDSDSPPIDPTESTTPTGSPATATPTAPASSAVTPPVAAPETETEADDPISQTLRVNVAGTTLLGKFYRAATIEERLTYLHNPDQSRLPFRNYSSRWEALPEAQSITYNKAMLDADSNRWYGLFEVLEKDNDKLHRWVAVEDESGEFYLDWTLYEQLADNALPRFLDDPTASPRVFKLSIQKGATVPENNNPWNSEAIGLLLQSPFDDQPARPIIMKTSDFKRFGFEEEISANMGKIARVEMSWVPSEFDPNSRVPIISQLVGWGAWE